MKNLLDVHTHTIASGHGFSTILENVQVAKEKNLEILGITDHVGIAHKTYFRNLSILPRKIEGIRLLKGAELNIIDYNGQVDLDNDTLKLLDIRIASLHKSLLEPSTKEDNTRALIKVMENPYIQIIGHPGDERFPIDNRKLVFKAKETNTLLEINNNSLNPKSIHRKNSKENIKEIALLCKKENVPIIMGSDAHFAHFVGDFTYCEELLKEINMPEELIVNKNCELFFNIVKREE